MNLLRIFKQWEFLRLGSRELMRLVDLKEWTREMSEVADILLEGAVQAAILDYEERYGSWPKAWRFAVIGMGKLGGRELNYSSDVDLLFLHETPPSDREAHVALNEVAENVIRILTEPTAEGKVFRVDMRLRPEGAGDMSKSREAYEEYYENRSDSWERQALLKARCCAGDRRLGSEFLKGLEPLIFRKNRDRDPRNPGSDESH
jgi:glutamate-ammonia-ligase adenylyltransferase